METFFSFESNYRSSKSWLLSQSVSVSIGHSFLAFTNCHCVPILTSTLGDVSLAPDALSALYLAARPDHQKAFVTDDLVSN